MKRLLLLLPLCAALCGCGSDARRGDTLWYGTPARMWEEALPVGNGHMGAMVFGDTSCERIQFNESTLYSGEPDMSVDGIRLAGCRDEVLRLLAAGDNAGAEALMQREWIGRLDEAYQPCGDLWLDMRMEGEVSDYRHELDMSRAVVTTSYVQDGVRIVREVFASHPHRAVVVRLSASEPVLRFDARLTSPHPAETLSSDGGLTVRGKAPAHVQRRTVEAIAEAGTQRLHPEYFDSAGRVIRREQVIYEDGPGGRGMSFEARLSPLSVDGRMTVGDGRILVEECREAVFVLRAATSFNGFDRSPSREGADPSQRLDADARLTEGVGYDALRRCHEADFGALYDRVALSLPETAEQAALPVDERLRRLAAGDSDAGLAALFFRMGRYLMISGSREDSQPLNLQGLWNERVIPPWNSGYTLNINLEMNYWPAEVAALPECHRPLFRFIGEIAENGRRVARDMYGLDGWTVHHNMSIWREGYPSDGFVYWFFWNMSGPWLCNHLWEHFLYTGDRDFLRRHYPLMAGSARFCAGWLAEDGRGELTTPVGTSPENHFIMPDGREASVCPGPTMDMALVRHLFARTVAAADTLGLADPLADTLRRALPRLRGYRTGSDGRLLEWDCEYGEFEPQHRHVSHLFGLYPGADITPETTAEFEAARASLLGRGDGATGWSMAWKTALWARLGDGERAGATLGNLLHYVDPTVGNPKEGGVYRNLLNALPFQIDGNFGAAAGIAEMLLQSHRGAIELLPALPAAWADGEVRGLRARGGFEVDIEWRGGVPVRVAVSSASGGACTVRWRDSERRLELAPGRTERLSFR